MCGNAFCKRTFVSDCDVPTLTTNFEELSDEVKEFLSKVPNLYVEDAAVCSGKLLETRIRSVTNDPATALLLKNMLVCRFWLLSLSIACLFVIPKPLIH